jgi:hypothetical protein
METCHFCEKAIPMTESGYNVIDISGVVRPVAKPKWKKVLLFLVIKDQDQQDVFVCRDCLRGIIKRLGRDLDAGIPMTAELSWAVRLLGPDPKKK